MRYTRSALILGIYLGFCAVAHGAAPGEVSAVTSAGTNSSFMNVLRRRAPLSMVATNGAVGANIRRYEHAAHQRDVLWLAMLALIENDDQAMQKVVKALEYGFSWQTSQGYFENGLGVSPKKAVGADAFFLQGYCRIQYLILNSRFSSDYGARIEAMNAKLPLALDWLKRNALELYRQDRAATNRLFFDAMALGLCGEVVDDAEAKTLGAEVFIAKALDNLRADGSFSEHGGFDSSYQAVSLLNIASLVQNLESYPRHTLMQAFERAARWQKGRIYEDGRVITDGNARTGVGREGNKEVNYFEVIAALFFAGYILEEPEYLRLGENVAEFVLRAIH